MYTKFRAGDLNSLYKGFTNLAWANHFGAEYMEEVDVEKIPCEGFPCERVGEGYLVKVKETVEEQNGDFALYDQRRRYFKSLFRKDMFMVSCD